MAWKAYNTVNGMIMGETSATGARPTDYLTDALGSVVATASKGTIQNTYRWAGYGQQVSKTGTSADPKFLWVGNAGSRRAGILQYNRLRHYSIFRFLSRVRQAEWVLGEHPYAYALNNPSTFTDPSGLDPTLSDCKKRGGKACFHCANFVFATKLRYCPKAACEAANQLCGTSVKCGPCGLCPTPPVPTSCFDRAALEKFGEFLRGSSGGKTWDCSASCGGYGNGDKLAHCFKGCAIAICIGITCGEIGKDDDPEDNDAEWTGYWIGYTQVHVGSASYVLSQCLEKCADAVSGMECY